MLMFTPVRMQLVLVNKMSTKMLTKMWRGAMRGLEMALALVVGRTADFHRARPLGLVARDREELQASSISSRGFFSGGGQRVGMYFVLV